MDIATPPQFILKKSNSLNSMAQDYHHHQGMFSFSNVFERSQQEQQQQQQEHQHQHQHQQQMAQQIRRDKMRVAQGFEPPPLLVTVDDVESSGGLPGYETAGMLSEMFNFNPGATTPAEDIQSDTQLAHNYTNSKPPPPPATPTGSEWYGHRQAGGTAVVGGFGSLDESKVQNLMNGNSAAAMQLFLMNPHEPRSPHSPSQSNFQNPPSISPRYALHHHDHHHQVRPTSPARVSSLAPSSQFTWVPADSSSQGLSLSLSSSLQHLEVSKAEELRMGDHGSAAMLFFHQGGGGSNNTSAAQYPYKNLSGAGENHQVNAGLGTYGLRNSKYARAAQELLEEFCSVGRGQLIKKKLGRNNSIINHNTNPKGSDGSGGGDATTSGGGGSGGGNSSSSSKDLPPLSASERVEHQRRKVKLLCMLDEVDRRYNHYCEQMQMVVNSFDLVMGFGAAVPYTALAQKAMSRHFRCLKDAIAAQLKHSCELLGEKDAGASGVTKGETPRLKLLEQSLRQQKAFYQMGMMEQEAWRPQRGLPERSVNILRAWLFEHFLHPYPSDADKHLLARQTGLSRNQVSNWFINARVRLWKPMVEDMYQQEAKEDAEERESNSQIDGNNNNNIAQTPTPNHTITTTPSSTAATPTGTTTATGKRSEINDSENDPSFFPLNRQCFSENQAKNACLANPTVTPAPMSSQSFPASYDSDEAYRSSGIMTSGNGEMGSTLIRFGNTSAGDVSLTLGLRHAGNVRDFGGC